MNDTEIQRIAHILALQLHDDARATEEVSEDAAGYGSTELFAATEGMSGDYFIARAYVTYKLKPRRVVLFVHVSQVQQRAESGNLYDVTPDFKPAMHAELAELFNRQ